jgi:predicted nucleic acid-binding protein
VSGFLLDTNVISELIRPSSEPKVAAWIDATDEELLFLSVLTLGEIRKGIVALPQSTRRTTLETWLSSDLPLRFANRILNIDQSVVDRWGHFSGLMSTRGVNVPVIDGLLAATAIQHNLTLVTRNTKDVAGTGVTLFNPWID